MLANVSVPAWLPTEDGLKWTLTFCWPPAATSKGVSGDAARNCGSELLMDWTVSGPPPPFVEMTFSSFVTDAADVVSCDSNVY